MKKITYLLTLLLLIVGGNESAFAAVDWGLSASSLESITANQTVVSPTVIASITSKIASIPRLLDWLRKYVCIVSWESKAGLEWCEIK